MKLALNNNCGGLAIVEIPDDVTDWEFSECDESVIYVLDGKIHHIGADSGINIDYDEGQYIIDVLNTLKECKEETK